MGDYSYSKEISQNSIVFYELDLEKVKKMFTKIFETYNPRVKPEIFDSFCQDFYDLAKDIRGSNERIWRMIIPRKPPGTGSRWRPPHVKSRNSSDGPRL